MSYDADVDAYYKDVTTDAEPFYFRLKYNNDNNSIYCSDWKSKNGTDAYTSGKEIIVNSETKIDCNNEIHGWTDKPAMYTNAVNGSTIRIWFDYQHKKTWITETTYTVTLANDGHGSVDVASVTAGKNTLSDEFTATPSDGYEFDSWEVTTGGANITLTSTTDNPTTVKATSTGTVRANFSALHYDVTLNANGGTGDDVTVEAIYDDDMPTEDKSSKDLVAPTKTGYDFAGYYDDADEGEGTQYYDEDLNSASIWDKASTATLYAHWTAKDYTVTLDKQSGATGYSDAGDIPNQTVTYNDDLPTITGTVPIGATGYKFVGFYTAASGGGVKVINADKSWVDDASITEDEVTTTYTEDGKWVYAGDVTLYAYYQNAEIATLPLSALMVHPWVSGETMDSITVTPTLTFAPEPTVLICYEIQYSDGSSVTDDGLQTFRNLGSNSIRFRAPKNPGSYRVKAQLKQNDCDGAVLDTKYSEFAVAGNYSVTVKYVCDGKAIRDQEVLTINSLDSTSVTAPAIARYTFARWSATEGITSNTSDNVNPKKYVASFDGTITATYVEKPIVYFKDNLGWGDVWVTYDASWNDSYGTGSSGKTYRHMQKLEGTDDIWYDEIPSTYTDNSFANWPWNIAFNSQEIHETYFNTGKAIFRRDFDPYNTFFVPAPDSIVSPYTKSGATYQSSYCDHYKDGVGNNYLYPGGYWKRYNSTYSGWSLRGSFNSWAGSNHNFIAESSDDSIFTTSVLLYKNNNNYF
ncbi:MAG: InlB B-repeat-containing protein, partial [Paludibacteraceae bacterium]|nr:InlB B-repeat-containing protein [Paludibacteraceae bacterium]